MKEKAQKLFLWRGKQRAIIASCIQTIALQLTGNGFFAGNKAFLFIEIPGLCNSFVWEKWANKCSAISHCCNFWGLQNNYNPLHVEGKGWVRNQVKDYCSLHGRACIEKKEGWNQRCCIVIRLNYRGRGKALCHRELYWIFLQCCMKECMGKCLETYEVRS